MNSFTYEKIRELGFEVEKETQAKTADMVERRAIAAGFIKDRSTDTSPFKGAQVLLINEDTWWAVGPNKRWSGMIETLELENVKCPIVITTNILAKNVLERLLKSFITIEGIHDLGLFLSQLELIGGNVIYPGDQFGNQN